MWAGLDRFVAVEAQIPLVVAQLVDRIAVEIERLETIPLSFGSGPTNCTTIGGRRSW